METFSALLALCAGNSLVSGEFLAQRPVTRSFDVFFDLHLIRRSSKHSRGWWFEKLSRPLWRHCNDDENRETARGPTPANKFYGDLYHIWAYCIKEDDAYLTGGYR